MFGDGLVSSIRAFCNGLIAGTACPSTKQSRRIRPTIKRIEKLSILCVTNPTYPTAVVVSLASLVGTIGRARIWLFVHFDADVIIVADLLLLLVIAPVLLGRFG